MPTIFITEKPAVAQDYRKILKVNSKTGTDGYIEGYSPVLDKNIIITWAIGHLVGICPPEEQNPDWGGRWEAGKLPMMPKTYKYQPLKSTAKQFKIVKSLYTRKDIDEIYYAGDSGREGIYIQALIRNQIFKSPPKIPEKVVWINSFKDEEVLRGIREAKPYSHYQSMIDSGYARAMTDWLIGMNFTVAYTLIAYKLINTGRVMTVVDAMVVERQQEIDAFKKTDYYGVKADNNIYWKAVEGSRFFEDFDLYNETGFTKLEKANALVNECNKDKHLKVENVQIKKKTEYAPLLFNFADLLAYCTRKFKFSPAQTAIYAQNIYEKKFITYPRTDSRYLTSGEAAIFASKGYNIPERYIDDSKVKDHFAIVPTLYGDASSLSGGEKDVYNVIYNRFMDTMKPPFIYDTVSVTYIHSNQERFFESFRNIKQYGFKEKGEDVENAVEKPAPKKNDIITVNEFSVRKMETKPPVPYTTGTLITAMEKAGKFVEDEELREQIKTCGIGTSATRHSIIEKLAEKKFITVDSEQKVAPTEFGKAIIPIIKKYDETLISPVKTAEMEEKLHAIEDGKLSLQEYRDIIESYVADTTKRILAGKETSLANTGNNSASSGKKFNCPCCNSELKFGRYGWYCDCKFSFGLEICGHKMKETDLEDLLNKGKTKAYSFKSKTGKTFKAKLVVDKENHKTGFEFVDTPKSSKKK